MMHFFHLNFLNALGILAQGIYNACTIFYQFSAVKNEGQSQQPSILSLGWLPVSPSALELVILWKAILIFQ